RRFASHYICSNDHTCLAGLVRANAAVCYVNDPRPTTVGVRNPEGRDVRRAYGTFMSSGLPIAGFMLIEANNRDHAIDLVAETPCPVATTSWRPGSYKTSSTMIHLRDPQPTNKGWPGAKPFSAPEPELHGNRMNI